MKKQTLQFLMVTCLIGISTIWYACQKESDNFENIEVSFNVLSKSTSNLKSSQAYELINADKVIITVQEDDGSPTDYTQYELDVHKMGNDFITRKITLPFGEYKVSEFYIIDTLDSIIYASPLEGSLMAQNVMDPLPVLFSVTEKKSKAVDVEVISTEKLKPEDFGLVNFPIIEVETFQFLVNVSELGTSKLLTTNLRVTSGSYNFSQPLDSIVDNIVTLKDGYPDYIMTIESPGYQTYVDTLTSIELKHHDSIPLVVELEKLTVTDYDGNVYQTVVIGNQVWMTENLKVTHYRNGDEISDGTGIGDYSGQTEPKYYFNNSDDINNGNIYGKLYTWYTATDNRNLCPVGWHLPSDAEWTQLTDYLGGESIARYKMKEIGTTHWNSPNTGATNESGFNGLPGGYSSSYGDFGIPGIGGYFWSSTTQISDALNAWSRVLYYNDEAQMRYPNGNGKKLGLSVRCLKD